MGLKFKCSNCGGFSKAFNRGLGELTRCSVCGKEVEIPTDPQLTEHIPDPEARSTNTESESSAKSAFAERGTWVSIVLWALAITNPLFGIMILITCFVRPRSVSVPSVIVGVLLIVSLTFIVGLMRRQWWGVWGYVAVFAAIIVLSVIEMNWEGVLRLLLSMFFFFLVVKSEWDYLK